MNDDIRRGFSLLEVLLVMGLFGIVAGFTLCAGITPFRYAMVRAQEEYERAFTMAVRGKALRHMCEDEECVVATFSDMIHEE